MIRIANAAGFLGDQLDAPRRLVEATTVDYLTLEYLAELTMSILARAKEKDPRAGYAGDFLTVLQSLLPALAAQSQLKIVTNAGGMNPLACAQEAAQLLAAAGLGDARIGVVTGDDLLPAWDTLKQAGCEFKNLDTGEAIEKLASPVVSANAYLGAAPLVEALQQDARIIITGRVADASLTVAPVMHAFGSDWQDWRRLAAYSVAGHLIECGAQVTGGYATQWETLDLTNVGYPIAEVEADGTTVITKPPGTGGEVSRRTVVEQLTYEIGDPKHYLTPDVDVDFTTVEVQELASDRVQVRGATGRPATEFYKVSLAYRDGYMAAGELLVTGREAVAKAQACGEMILARTAAAGYRLQRSEMEILGAGGAAGQPLASDAREVMLRVAAHDPHRAALERFTREFAPLITSGPAGLAGYAAGRPSVRSVFAYWPTLVPKSLVTPQVEVQLARAWATKS